MYSESKRAKSSLQMATVRVTVRATRPKTLSRGRTLRDVKALPPNLGVANISCVDEGSDGGDDAEIKKNDHLS